MFNVFFTNFGYTDDKEHASLHDAKAAGIAAGFEFTVLIGTAPNRIPVAQWTTFGGWKQLYADDIIEQFITRLKQS